jgi:simple sugar transport system permease protein
MENNTNKAVREPLFHIVKRGNISVPKKVFIYAIAILVSLLLGAILCSAVSPRGNVAKFFSSLYEGCFGTERRTWLFLQEFAILLAVSMALIISFKMKFWNLGANGQILIGGLASIACSYYLGGKVSETVLILLCVLSSALAGAIWAVIPAICKALWNTNETLFTLMLNYIASGLVSLFIAIWVTGGSGVLKPLAYGKLPEIYNKYFLFVLFGILVTIFVTIYLKYTKHGYELSVVGDSQNTAKYIGINVKKVIIRTLIISGAISGLVGLLLTNGMSNTIGAQTAANRGFTAIMTTWLANCNPLFAIATCGLVVFTTKGMEMVRPSFGMLDDTISNLVIGIVYFFIIACAFFVQYKIVFNAKITAVLNKIAIPFNWLYKKIESGVLFIVNKVKSIFNKKENTKEEDK